MHIANKKLSCYRRRTAWCLRKRSAISLRQRSLLFILNNNKRLHFYYYHL